MCQPCSPECLCDFSVDSVSEPSPLAGSQWPMGVLALVALGVLDFWLVMELVQSIDAVLAQRDERLIFALAAIGCALEAGAALLLTWLLIEDHTGSERTVFS